MLQLTTSHDASNIDSSTMQNTMTSVQGLLIVCPYCICCPYCNTPKVWPVTCLLAFGHPKSQKASADQCCGHSDRNCQLSMGVGSEVVRLCLPLILCFETDFAPDSGVLGSSISSPTSCSGWLSTLCDSGLAWLLMPKGSKAGSRSCTWLHQVKLL